MSSDGGGWDSPAGRPERSPDSKPFICRNCGGTAPKPGRLPAGDPVPQPAGWYNLTVSVPYPTGTGKHYIWVGLFCSAACLIAYGAELEQQEAVARLWYEAVVPEPPAAYDGPPHRRREPRP